MKLLLFGYGSAGQRHARNIRALDTGARIMVGDPACLNSLDVANGYHVLGICLDFIREAGKADSRI